MARLPSGHVYFLNVTKQNGKKEVEELHMSGIVGVINYAEGLVSYGQAVKVEIYREAKPDLVYVATL